MDLHTHVCSHLYTSSARTHICVYTSASSLSTCVHSYSWVPLGTISGQLQTHLGQYVLVGLQSRALLGQVFVCPCVCVYRDEPGECAELHDMRRALAGAPVEK